MGALQLSPSKRGYIAGLRTAGWKVQDVADEVGCAKSTVTKIFKKWREAGTTRDKPRSGRPPKMSRRAVRNLERDIEREPRLTWEVLARRYRVSRSLVRNQAAKLGYRKRVMRKRPFLTEESRKKRLAWLEKTEGQDWSRVIWTDEASVEIGELCGRAWTIRKKGQENDPKHIVCTYKSGRKSLMVWGAIARDYRFPLVRFKLRPAYQKNKVRYAAEKVTSAVYSQQILSGPLKDYARLLTGIRGGPVKVMEDGASVHASPTSVAARKKAGITPLYHPPSSPDLNPIEVLWFLLKRRLGLRYPRAMNLDALWEDIQYEWSQISIKTVNKVIDLMEERRKRVRERRGLYTGF